MEKFSTNKSMMNKPTVTKPTNIIVDLSTNNLMVDSRSVTKPSSKMM
jgi:hypothetical protein